MFDDEKYLKKSLTPLTIYHLLTHRPKEIIIYIDRIKVHANTDINKIFREKDKLLETGKI